MPVPQFTSLGSYRRQWPSHDAVAGLTVWAVLVPRGARLRLDRRSVAGRWPVRRATPLIWYAAFGSSRHLITGRMSATAALSAAAAGSTIEF
jgi:MFS superfamily sulfate permease-like transporter